MRRYMRRGMTGREKRRLLLFLVCAALIALAVTAMTQLRPILTSLATARVSNAVTRVVNTSVNETLYDAGVDYDRLISLEKDNEGHITAVKSNMAEFNRLQSAVLADVLQRLSEVSTRELAIPLGSLTGSPLLAGRGPLLHIKMQSVGSSSAHFENAFASAGINQTRHEIRLVVDVYVSVLLPAFRPSPRSPTAAPSPRRSSSAPCRIPTPTSTHARICPPPPRTSL